jgi:hypothetical protein
MICCAVACCCCCCCRRLLLLLLLLLLQTAVDVVLGDSPVLSRHHARILYNFVAKQWELLVEVSTQTLENQIRSCAAAAA